MNPILADGGAGDELAIFGQPNQWISVLSLEQLQPGTAFVVGLPDDAGFWLELLGRLVNVASLGKGISMLCPFKADVCKLQCSCHLHVAPLAPVGSFGLGLQATLPSLMA